MSALSGYHIGQLGIGSDPVELPPIYGVAYIGYTLTCPGMAPYQWYSNGVALGGEVASTHVVTLADEGTNLTCTADGVTHGIASNWIPKDLAGLQYWFDAFDTGNIVLSGPAVTAWLDRNGSAIAPAQATGSKQPLYDAVGFGGYPTVDFDGVDDGLRYYNAAGIPEIALSVPKASFHGIGDIDFIPTSRRAMHAVSTAVGTGQGIRCESVFNGTLVVNAWELRGRRLDADALMAYPTDIMPVAGPQMVSAIYEPDIASGRYRVNGVQSADVTFQTPGNFGPTLAKAVGVGSHTGANADYWPGKISEVFMYNAKPDVQTQAKLEGYLAWRWRQQALLPTDHPYKTMAPS